MKKPDTTRASGATTIRRSGDRKAEIVEAATRRFSKYGFKNTTVREIANDVGIQSGSLYYHFDTKEDILREAVLDTAIYVRDGSARIVEQDADPETKIATMVLFHLNDFVDNHAVHTVLYNERREIRVNPEFQAVKDCKKDTYEVWFKILKSGVEAAQFDATLDPYQTIRTIVRMLNSAADWYSRGDETISGAVEKYTFDEVKAFYLQFIIRAIRNPARASEPMPLTDI